MNAFKPYCLCNQGCGLWGGREALEMSGCYRNVTKRVERIEPLDLTCLVWIYRLEVLLLWSPRQAVLELRAHRPLKEGGKLEERSVEVVTASIDMEIVALFQTSSFYSEAHLPWFCNDVHLRTC